MRSGSQNSRYRLPRSAKFLIGAAIGSGSMALAAERGGADFLLAINAGRLRNMGAPSIASMMPIFDARLLMEQFAREELLTQCKIPVLLGVNVWGHRIDPVETAESLRGAGFAGAVNFPSCMHYSRPMQQILARAGRGIEREVEQLRAAQDAGLTSMFYCATRTQARLAADAGIDLVCLNLGWNVGGTLGHSRRARLEEVAASAHAIGRLLKRINPRTRFFLEGGPIATAEDLGQILRLAPIDGYVGGSTFERMPLEVSVADQIDRFRQAGKRSDALDRQSAGLLTWSRKLGFVGRSPPQLSFLRRLRALAAASNAVLVLADKGIPTRPILRALGGGTGANTPTAMVDVHVAGDDIPARARNLLFGHPGTLEKRLPALADRAVDLLVIHGPERLPAATQRRLARALREGTFRAPGTRRTLPVVPRVVLVSGGPVTDRRVEEDLLGLGLEPDLMSLAAGWTLRVPTLRARIDDLMTLLEAQAAESLGMSMDRSWFSSAALQHLHAHPWPGNEDELRSVLGALAGRAEDGPIQPAELLPLLRQQDTTPQDGRTEKDRIVDALWRHGFNRTRTAKALSISRKTLYNKIQKFGLSG